MNFKLFLRLVVFLAMLFFVLYIGMYNTHRISFSFPLAFQHDIVQPACYIFFAVFAVGVLGGALLTVGSGGGGKRSSKEK